eukprot:356411-Chlamydomonas_euryale.AAC.7
MNRRALIPQMYANQFSSLSVGNVRTVEVWRELVLACDCAPEFFVWTQLCASAPPSRSPHPVPRCGAAWRASGSDSCAGRMDSGLRR